MSNKSKINQNLLNNSLDSNSSRPTLFDAAEALYSNNINSQSSINRSESGFAIIFTILYHIRDLASTIIASEPLEMVGNDLERETFMNVRQVFVELRDQSEEQDIKVGQAVENFLHSLSKLLNTSLTDIIKLDIVQVWNKIVQVLTAVMPPFHDIFLGHIPQFNIAFHYVIPHYIKAYFTSDHATLESVLKCCLDKARNDYESDTKNNDNMSNAIIIHRAPEILVIACESSLTDESELEPNDYPLSMQFPDTLDLSIYQTPQSKSEGSKEKEDSPHRLYDLIAIVSQDTTRSKQCTSYLRLPQDTLQYPAIPMPPSLPKTLHNQSTDYLINILTNGVPTQPIDSLEKEKQRIAEFQLVSEYRDAWVKATDAKGPLTNDQAVRGNYYSSSDVNSHVPRFLLYVKRGLSELLTRLQPFVSKAGQCRAMGDMTFALASTIDSYKEARKYYEEAIAYDSSYKEFLTPLLASMDKIDAVQQGRNLEEQGDVSLVNHRLKESYEFYSQASASMVSSLTELKDLSSLRSSESDSLIELPGLSSQLMGLNNLTSLSKSYENRLREKSGYVKQIQSLEIVVHCIEKGEEALRECKYPVAKEYYNRAIKMSAKSMANEGNEADAKYKHFHVINAYIEKTIQTLVAIQKIDEAHIAMKEGKYRLANQLFTEAIVLVPDKAAGLQTILDGFTPLIQCEDALIKQRLGLAAIEEKNFTSAITLLTEAIELLPIERVTDLAIFLCDRGLAYHECKDYDTAVEDFNRAIALRNDYALAYFRKGATYFAINNYDESIKSYDRAETLDNTLSAQIKVKLRQINTAKEVAMRKEREAERARIKEEERKQIEQIRREKQEKVLQDNEKIKMKEEDKRSRQLLAVANSVTRQLEPSINLTTSTNSKLKSKDSEKAKLKEEEKLQKLKEKERIKLEKERERERLKQEKEEQLREKLAKENEMRLKQLKLAEEEKQRLEQMKEKEIKDNQDKIKRNQLLEQKIAEKEKERLRKEKEKELLREMKAKELEEQKRKELLDQKLNVKSIAVEAVPETTTSGLGFDLPIASTIPIRSVTTNSYFASQSMLDSKSTNNYSIDSGLNTSLSIMSATNHIESDNMITRRTSSELSLPIDINRTNSLGLLQPKPGYSFAPSPLAGLGIPSVTSPNNLSEIPLSRSTSINSVNSRSTNAINNFSVSDVLGETLGVSLRGLGLNNVIIDSSDAISRPSTSSSFTLGLSQPDSLHNFDYSPREQFSIATNALDSSLSSGLMLEGLLGKKTSSQMSLLPDEINIRTNGVSDLNASAPLWTNSIGNSLLGSGSNSPFDKSSQNIGYSNGLGFELRTSYSTAPLTKSTNSYDMDSPLSSRTFLQQLPDNYFPDLAWLRSHGIATFATADYANYAVNLTSYVISHFAPSKINELMLSSGCAMRITEDYVNGSLRSFLMISKSLSNDSYSVFVAMKLINEYLRNILVFNTMSSYTTSDPVQMPYDINEFPPLAPVNALSTSTAGLSLGGILGNDQQSISNLPASTNWAKSSSKSLGSLGVNFELESNNFSVLPDDYAGLLTSSLIEPDILIDESSTFSDTFSARSIRPDSMKVQPKNGNFYHRIVAIPREAVGLIIGQQGKKIKDMCVLSGAKIQFRVNKTAERERRPGLLHLQGSYENVEAGLTLIWNLLQSLGKEYVELPLTKDLLKG
eukprot:gene16988-22485_t